MSIIDDEEHFRKFAEVLKNSLGKYQKVSKDDLLAHQRTQLRHLLSLEKRFKRELIRSRKGRRVYEKFIDFIYTQKCGILSARPFFRERHIVFSKRISSALKKKNPKLLYPFRFNYNFIVFAMKVESWGARSEIKKIAKEISEIRNEILVTNTPLAISESRKFWNITPKSHLTYMDIVQIHCNGLLTGIDKFVPLDDSNMTEEDSLKAYRTFRAVAIGRMTGDRVSSYNETLIHFYPTDKRKIYRANKALKQLPKDNINYEEVAKYVNSEIENPHHRTDAEEISKLVSGASVVSGDCVIGEHTETTIERFSAPEDEGPAILAEQNNTNEILRNGLRGLDLMTKKVLKMKGVMLDG
jgi:DNA-directed RNA polymerase specialized sigma subunit